MSGPVPYSTIRDLILQGANVLSNPRWVQGDGPSLLMKAVNLSLKHLDDQIVLKRENYRTMSGSISILKDTAEYPLPNLFYKLLNLYYELGGIKYPVTSYELAMEPMLANAVDLGVMCAPFRYTLIDNTIRFTPTPRQSVSAVIEYVRTTPAFTGPASVIDLVNGWERFVIPDVIGWVLEIEGLDSSAAVARSGRALGVILEAATSRNQKDPPQFLFYPDDIYYTASRQ